MPRSATARLLVGSLAVGCIVTAAWFLSPSEPPPWSDAERAVLRSLSLASLPPLPADPSNAVADHPAAALFGQRLFFDPRLSSNGAVSCASCHQPALGFTDGLPLSQGVGTANRHTPSILGSAYSPWLYWDGRKNSLWSQALAPLEDPQEHGGHRDDHARLISDDDQYRASYEQIFGAFPDLTQPYASTAVFVNVGKALGAFQRRIEIPNTRFDGYVATVLGDPAAPEPQDFGYDEILGLRLFIGKAQCIQCHNGPLLANHEFHNTGVLAAPGQLPDRGRIDGWRQLEADPFNCFSDYSDDPQPECAEQRFARSGAELLGAFRTPTLRNVAQTAPYMHRGQLATLGEVIAHYVRAPPAMIGHNEIKALNLNRRERAQLEAFLHTLTGAPQAPDLLSQP